MTLFLDDGDVRLYQGDALEQLHGLPDGCVDMVATSPPFYGLRDDGTGEWEGGDEGCDHRKRPATRDATSTLAGTSNAEGFALDTYRDVCGKCGARRVDRQIGLEETPQAWVDNLVAVFRECRRVLADHGTLWVEIGDSYGSNSNGGTGESSAKQNSNRGSNHDGATHRHPTKPKDLLGQPWMLAFALRADGWYLRSEIIWARPNPMPESVTDRPTKSHSTVFLLSKRPRYFYDADAIRETYVGLPERRNGRVGAYQNRAMNHIGDGTTPTAIRDPNPAGANARSVWQIATEPTPFAHFATWPQKLVARMIQAGTSERGKCPVCGKPWVRDVEVEHGPDKSSEWHVTAMAGVMTGGVGKNFRRSVGWSPSCACASSVRIENGANVPWVPVPCTVLDPFAGSGTTLLVARYHGRHAIGIELNADYCALAADRLSQLSLLTGDAA